MGINIVTEFRQKQIIFVYLSDLVMLAHQELVHIVPLSLPPPVCSQRKGSPDHICFAVVDLKPKEVVSLAHESLAAYQNFHMLFDRFDLRMLVDEYELVVVAHQRILGLDTLAADRTSAEFESMDAVDIVDVVDAVVVVVAVVAVIAVIAVVVVVAVVAVVAVEPLYL
jgi:hypothetical protein